MIDSLNSSLRHRLDTPMLDILDATVSRAREERAEWAASSDATYYGREIPTDLPQQRTAG